MLKYSFYVFFSFFLIFLLIFTSCNETGILETKPNVEQNANQLSKNNNKVESGNKLKFKGKIIGYKEIEENGKIRKIPIYDSGPDEVDIKAMVCNYYKIYVSEFYQYKEKPGKYICIQNQQPSLKSPSELRDKWGFSGYKVGSENQKKDLVKIGYNSTKIMVGIHIDNPIFDITGEFVGYGNYTIPQGDFDMYFIDEPWERYLISKENVLNIANQINSAKLFLSSWKDNTGAKDWYKWILNRTSNTRMMCDQYYDGTIFYGDAQWSYWYWFRDNYGSSKIESHWAHLVIDGKQNDFGHFFSKANQFGLNTLWLYAGDANDSWPGIDDKLNSSNYSTYLSDFCREAFYKGWLRRFNIKYTYWYKCPNEYGDPCYCQDNSTGWILDAIVCDGIVEVYP